MKQLMRKLTALLLVLAMVMSLAVTAAAAESSAGDGSGSAQQEVEPVDAVKDLDEVTSEEEDEEAEEDTESQKDTDESAQAAPEEASEAEESAGDADASENESSEEDAQEDTLAVQSAAGWSVDGENITLTYFNGTNNVNALGGLFAVPAQELDVNGSTWSFGAGVYEFNDQGKLVVGPYSAIQTASIVNVLDETLTQVGKDERTLDITAGDLGTTKSQTTVTPGAVLRSRKDGNTYYFQGLKYTGYYRDTAKSALLAVKDGTAANYSGQMVWTADLTTYVVNNELVEGDDVLDGLWYYNGKVYTGFFRNSEAEDSTLLYGCVKGVAEPYGGCMDTQKDAGKLFKTYLVDNKAVNKFDEKWYVEGKLFTGYYENVDTKVLYLLNKGKIVKSPNKYLPFIGIMSKQTINGVTYSMLAQNNKIQPSLNGKYYEKGKLLTGVPSVKPTDGVFPKLYLYSKGVKQNVDDGWYKTRPANEFWKPYVYYYFKNNEAIHGKENVKLKAIQNGKYKDSHYYYYTFDKVGHLVTNLVEYYNGKSKDGGYKLFKNKQFRIFCDHTNYTGTILMYNPKDKSNNGGWNIPIKSFVISMSKSKTNGASDGTNYGNYTIASGSNGFYKFKSPKTGNISYFSSSRHIWGSGSMFHGAAYKKPNRMYMMASSYNNYGKAQTQHCVRVQNINMELIKKMYSMAPKKTNNGRKCTKNIRVVLSKSNKNNHMPFGQMTLLNNCDFNGYLLQKTNAYGKGKNMSFDPTDHNLKGTTIYVSTKKTSKKADCQQVKMDHYAGYSVYYKKA